MRRLKRAWCRLVHESIMFAGGAAYTCRRCGERFENPALNGSLRAIRTSASHRAPNGGRIGAPNVIIARRDVL